MKDSKLVWSDEDGDLRKAKDNKKEVEVDESLLTLHLRRLTSGKGRVIIEISNIPCNKNWCKKLTKRLKKSLGVGGAYKDTYIEVHGEQLEKLKQALDGMCISYKQTGG